MSTLPQLRSSLKSIASVRQVYDQLFDSLTDALSTAQTLDANTDAVQELKDMIDAALEAVVDNVNELNETEHNVHLLLTTEMRAGV